MSDRILVVDDTPSNIQTIASVLKEHGYQISVATDGKQALGVLERVRPDLILLDVEMPEMDGFETCRRIKEHPDLRQIPIIYLTGKTEAEDIVRGFELGAVDYVGKPFNSHELLARVNTHLTIDRLNRENERLLLNVLPASIAERLKAQEGTIADRFDDVSVLFADIVGFTALSSRLPATELVDLLNGVFTAFDGLVDAHGLEKIKTVGDAYMVAGGLLESREHHLEAMASFALEMIEVIRSRTDEASPLEIRIGMHVGSVVAGVIGIRKFSYDIWGDTVNTASRLESSGVVGRIQTSEAVKERLEGRYEFERRGLIDLKGKGPTPAYLLVGRAGSE